MCVCVVPIVPTRIIRGMSTPQVTSTTTIVTMQIGALPIALMYKWKLLHSSDKSAIQTQGTETLALWQNNSDDVIDICVSITINIGETKL